VSAAPHPRDILIATVHDGAKASDPVCMGYMLARERLLHMGILAHTTSVFAPDDLPRSRARLVSQALRMPGWKYLFWWDDDVVPHDPEMVMRMHLLAHREGLDVLGAPYPRKRIPIDIPYHPLPGATTLDFFIEGGAEVACVGIGFCLMSRRCLEAMTEHYREELWATDDVDPERREMVCLFDPMFTPTEMTNGVRTRFKLSEDYSIQHRWRAMGGKVYMYAEQGMKLGHAGRFTFVGTFDDIGRPR